jgi:hypothetical protein
VRISHSEQKEMYEKNSAYSPKESSKGNTSLIYEIFLKNQKYHLDKDGILIRFL